MKIEQTGHFCAEVKHLISYAREYMYCKGWEERSSEYLNGKARYRGYDYMVKAAKKANQVLHKRVYDWTAVLPCKGVI